MNPSLYNEILAIIAGICFISFLYFGLYTLSFTPKEKHHRMFFLLCMFSSLWCLLYVIYYLSIGTLKDIMERCIFAGMITFVFLLLWAVNYFDLIKNRKLLRFFSFAIWLPPLAYVYKSISENAVADAFPFGFWFLYTQIYTTIINFMGIFLMLIFSFRNMNYKRKRIQALIISISAVIFITASWIFDYVLGFQSKQNLMPLWLLLWFIPVLYSIKKYRFLTITPEFINRDISENVEEGIILLDTDLKIIFKNKAISNMLNLKDGDKVMLEDIVFGKDVFINELLNLKRTNDLSFSTRTNFILPDNKKCLLADIKVKKLIDTYNDISGFLIIAKTVNDLKQFKSQYSISSRELDVIHHIIIGRKNKEIAEILDVTESTVKTHVASIYGKLQVNNRVELLNLLSEFNVI